MRIPPDVVYFVRPGDYNEELRYSLRSLRNFPHKRVWIVGHTPSWVQNVWSIPGNLHSSKYRNVPDNIRIACETLTARRLVIFNDDFYVTAPVTELPSLHRVTLREHIKKSKRGPWRQSLRETMAWARERGLDPKTALSYELHVPVAVDRKKMLAAVRECLDWPGGAPPQWRTVYGLMWGVAAEPAVDGKLMSARSRRGSTAFLSSEDNTFRVLLRRELQDLFPDPSPYEVTMPAADELKGEIMSTTFACTRYPALALRVDGHALKFAGGRLVITDEDLADGVRDFSGRRPEYGISEIAVEVSRPGPVMVAESEQEPAPESTETTGEDELPDEPADDMPWQDGTESGTEEPDPDLELEED